jgi:hypothetical protein
MSRAWRFAAAFDSAMKGRLYYLGRGEGGFIITSFFVLVVVVFVCLAASFWYAEKQKAYYDAEIDRLCAIDGGINVYETVKLPPERFDQRWNEYLYVREPTTYIRTESENPSLLRDTSKIIRRSDGKVLGEYVSYVRRGGDLPGPGHPSSYRCPKLFTLNLEQAVFLKETDQ